jgi:hypothetical protein
MSQLRRRRSSWLPLRRRHNCRDEQSRIARYPAIMLSPGRKLAFAVPIAAPWRRNDPLLTRTRPAVAASRPQHVLDRERPTLLHRARHEGVKLGARALPVHHRRRIVRKPREIAGPATDGRPALAPHCDRHEAEFLGCVSHFTYGRPGEAYTGDMRQRQRRQTSR